MKKFISCSMLLLAIFQIKCLEKLNVIEFPINRVKSKGPHPILRYKNEIEEHN